MTKKQGLIFVVCFTLASSILLLFQGFDLAAAVVPFILLVATSTLLGLYALRLRQAEIHRVKELEKEL